MMNEKLDAIALFICVVDMGSLSGAARKTGLSISTISRQLTKLEQKLAIRLLIRSTRKLVLTEAGQYYYAATKNLLLELDQAELTLNQSLQEATGNIHISSPTLFGRMHLVPIMSEFLLEHPKINLEMTLLDRTVDVLDEGIDVAIKIGALADSSLLSRKLGEIRWVVCAAPQYLKTRGIPKVPADLMQHDCLVYSQYRINPEWEFYQKNAQIKLKVPVRMRANTIDAVVDAASKGVGVVMAPAWFVAEHIQNKKLQIILSEYEQPPREIHALFTHKHLLANKVRILLDYLVKQLAENRF